jgi:mannose-6-phosphate isomerase-like protein (cupin superfamily)
LSEAKASILDLAETYLHLSDGAAVSAVEVGPNFWSTLRDRTDLQAGRLVVITHEKADWSTWEMHPDGDEVVALLSGEVDLVLQEGSRESTLSLKGRGTVIVPQGVWHRAIVHKAGEMLFITRGAGTQHRPV